MHSQPNFKGWRIKLYELETTGAWLDLGTGLVCCKSVHELGVVLQIISEDKPEFMLLQSKIQFEDVYETQGDNIIMWREYNPNSGHAIDYAISFQDPIGCQNIWDAITEVRNQFNQQREYGYSNIVGFKDTYNSQVGINTSIETNNEYCFMNEEHSIKSLSHSNVNKNDINNSISSHSVSLYGTNVYSSFSYGNNNIDAMLARSPLLLPYDLQEDDVLHRIRYKLENVYASQKECIVTQLLDKDGDYLYKLFNKFSDLESKQDDASLAILAEVMRSILLLNDASIIEFLLSKDAIFYQVAGILEYDKELRSRSNYREYLFKQSKQKEVVSISLHWKTNEAEEVRASINLLFRLKYLRDIMIHPKIDEQCTTALGSMINFTNNEICCEMFKNISYMANVLKVICPDVDISAYITDKNTQSKLDSPVAVIGPMPSSNTTNNSATISENNNPPLAIAVEVDQNLIPIHGLYFFRELFTMSRSILVEKRQELYNFFYSKLETPFLFVINKLLYDAELYRTTTNDPSNVNSFPFSSNQYELAMQIVGEVLSSIVIVCPSIIKHSILSHVIPLFNPTSNSATNAVGAIDQISSPSSTLISGIVAVCDKENNPSGGGGGVWYRSCLLYLMIDQLLNSSDAAAIQSFSDVLKILLELEKTPNSAVLKTENNKFLSIFYDYYLSWLLVPFLDDIDLISAIPQSYYIKHKLPIPVALMISSTQNRSGIVASRRNIFEILIQCVQTHSYRFKYFAMRNNIISKIVNKSLYSKDQSWLHLSAIKFLRAVLTTKDEFYFKHIEKIDLLKGMFQILNESKHKDNLITSAIHDFIECIRAENIKLLIIYVMSKYSDCFPEKRYVEVYDKLKIRYEQIVDGKIDYSISYQQQNTNNSNTGTMLLDRSYASNNNVDIDRVHGQLNSHEQIYSSSLMRRNKKFLDSDHEEEYFFGEDDDDDDEDNSRYHSSHGSRKIRKVDENHNSGTEILDNIVNNAFALKSSTSSVIDSDNISINSSNSSSSLSNPLLAMLNIYGNDDDGDEKNNVAVIIPSIDIIETPIQSLTNKEINLASHNKVPSNTTIDIFAGEDFVKSETSDTTTRIFHDDSIVDDDDDVTHATTTAEPLLSSLPPLKSRFEYDDDADMITFDMKSFNNQKANYNVLLKQKTSISVQSVRPSTSLLENTVTDASLSNSSNINNLIRNEQPPQLNNSNNNSSSNTAGALISFSLKKKQV